MTPRQRRPRWAAHLQAGQGNREAGRVGHPAVASRGCGRRQVKAGVAGSCQQVSGRRAWGGVREPGAGARGGKGSRVDRQGARHGSTRGQRQTTQALSFRASACPCPCPCPGCRHGTLLHWPSGQPVFSALTRGRDVRGVQDPLLAAPHHPVPRAGAVGVFVPAARAGRHRGIKNIIILYCTIYI